MAGRPRLSDKEKKLKGTLQPCRVNDKAPVSKLSNEVKPTKALTGLAKKIWQRTLKFLQSNDLMGDADIELLTAYCVEMELYFKHSKKAAKIERDNDKLIADLKKEPLNPLDYIDAISKLPRPDRWHRMASACFDKAIKISDRFGFSPLHRQKLQVNTEQEEEDIVSNLLQPNWRGEVKSAEA